MNYKKIILLTALIMLLTVISVSSVSAISANEKTEAKKLLIDNSDQTNIYPSDLKNTKIVSIKNYNNSVKNITLKSTYYRTIDCAYEKNGKNVVKHNGKYMKKYRKTVFVQYCFYIFQKQSDGKFKFMDWDTGKDYEKTLKIIYKPAKKGTIIKEYGNYIEKRVEKKGKVYEYHYGKYKKVLSPTKAIITKKFEFRDIVGYYKVYKMPYFNYGGYKWATFKGNSFTYGNSYLGYYINHINENDYYNPKHRIYKITPKTSRIIGTNIFKKKPTSFKIYVKA